MAFNLNKNDVHNASSKTKSKFELSKNTIVPQTPPRKSNLAWVFSIVFLIIGGVTWYFVSRESNTNQNNNVNSVPKVADNEQVVEPQLSPAITNENVANKIPVSFASGTATFETIDKVMVDNMLKMLSDNKELKVQVRGYASSEGPARINQSISKARADAFRSYLITQGINANRISAIGMGTTQPIASNDSEFGRKKNRRVEVALR